MNEFKLFTAGRNDRTLKIIADLESRLAAVFGEDYDLQTIDVIIKPHIAQQEGILATPTLVKVNLPRKKVLGDFSDIEMTLKNLGIPTPPCTPKLNME